MPPVLKHAVLTTGLPAQESPCLSFKLFILLCRWIPSVQKEELSTHFF